MLDHFKRPVWASVINIMPSVELLGVIVCSASSKKISPPCFSIQTNPSTIGILLIKG